MQWKWNSNDSHTFGTKMKYTVIKKKMDSISLRPYFIIRTSDKYDGNSSLEVECWNEDETHAAQQSPTQVLQNSRMQKTYAA